MDLALNNLQRLICHKTQQTKPNQTYTHTHTIYIYIYKYIIQIWIIQWKKNALRVSVAGRENISPILLAHTVMIWICTRLQHVIAAENLTACEDHESTRRAGVKNIILLPENVNRMMRLWIRFTPTVFTSPLLTISVLETLFASQEFSGPRVIR